MVRSASTTNRSHRWSTFPPEVTSRSAWARGVPLLPDYGPSTMDADVYRDPVRFELERERVLGTHWLLAGRSEQVAEPGDWLTYEGHGETVVVTRQPDGSLAAFHNVCQHRGPAIVGEPVGCGARRFTCPYHGWVYDTTGLVVGVPDRDDFDPAHLDGLRAPAVAADEWGGWVWINLAGPDARPPLIDSIGPEIAADLGRFRMDDMILHEVVEWDVPVSYKAIVDGFNEIYHTKQLHGVSAPSGSRPHATRRSTSSATTTCASCRGPRSSTNSPPTRTTTGSPSATTSCSRTPCSTAIPNTSRCSSRSRSTSTAPASCAGS